MRLLLLLMALVLALPAGRAPADNGCPPLMIPDGLSAGVDFLLVGEPHGTVEAPALVGDLACALSAQSRPLLIGVEHPANSQAALDAWMASDGGPQAEAALLAAPAWLRRDGRSSAAMLDLVRRVRVLKASGRDVALVAFDHEIPQPGTSIEREARMAALLIEARADRPDALVVALTGAGHADRTAFTSTTPPAPSMIRNLPTDRARSLAFVRLGGEAWGCRGQPADCSIQPLTARDRTTPRGIVPGAGREGFDGVVSIGAPFTASTWAADAAGG